MAVKTARINTVSFSYSNVAKNWLVCKPGDILTLVQWAGGQMYVDLATPESLIWGICDDKKVFSETNEIKELDRVNYTPIAWDNTYKMEVSGEWTPKVGYFYTMTADQKIDLSTESDSVGQFMVQDINDAYIEVRFVSNQGLFVPQYSDVRLESIRETNPDSDPFDGLYTFVLSNGTEISGDFSALAWYLWDVEITGNLLVDKSLTVTEDAAITGDATIGGTADITGKITGGNGAEITGDLSATWDATIGGAAAVTWNLSTDGNATVAGTATIGGNTSITGDISATGDATVGWTLGVTGNTTLGGTADITWDTTIGGDTSITGDTTIGGDATVSGKVAATGDVQTQADLKAGADLHVGWDATIAGDTTIQADVTITWDTAIGGETHISWTLWVASAAQFNSAVDIDQDLNVDGSGHVGGSLRVDHEVTVNEELILGPNATAPQFILQAEKNVANGVAALDANGKISDSVLPPLAIGETFVVSSEADMLALTAQRGDICVRTDISKTYIKLNNDNPSTMADWQLFYTSGEVISVNGQTGTVVLDADDIDDTTTTNKFVTAAEKTTWNNKQNAIWYTPENQAYKDTISLVNSADHYPSSSLTATLLAGKQDTIGYTPENVANKDANALTDSTTKYPSSHAVLDKLTEKENVTNKDTSTLVDSTSHYPSSHVMVDQLATKQATLVSGTNIKTINNQSLLGSGNIDISINIAFYTETTSAWATTYTLQHTPISDSSIMVFTDSGTALFPTTDYTCASGVITFSNLWATEHAIIRVVSAN